MIIPPKNIFFSEDNSALHLVSRTRLRDILIACSFITVCLGVLITMAVAMVDTPTQVKPEEDARIGIAIYGLMCMVGIGLLIRCFRSIFGRRNIGIDNTNLRIWTTPFRYPRERSWPFAHLRTISSMFEPTQKLNPDDVIPALVMTIEVMDGDNLTTKKLGLAATRPGAEWLEFVLNRRLKEEMPEWKQNHSDA